MENLFIDTGAWIALEVTNDQSHLAASAFFRQEGFRYRWITTNWIMSEAVTWIARHSTHAAAVAFGKRVRSSRKVEILRVSEAHEEHAWKIFVRYADKNFGFVDCTSFAVMESLEIQYAFAFDKHFRQFGFQTLPLIK